MAKTKDQPIRLKTASRNPMYILNVPSMAPMVMDRIVRPNGDRERRASSWLLLVCTARLRPSSVIPGLFQAPFAFFTKIDTGKPRLRVRTVAGAKRMAFVSNLIWQPAKLVRSAPRGRE
eukprot:scaffold5013_cov273-Pinguiococcus_pyrenoidosus.AAC.9